MKVLLRRQMQRMRPNRRDREFLRFLVPRTSCITWSGQFEWPSRSFKGIAERTILNVWIFKEHILGLGEQLAEEGRLSGAARSRYHHGWKMSRRLLNDFSQLSRDKSHMSIVKQYFRIIKSQRFWI